MLGNAKITLKSFDFLWGLQTQPKWISMVSFVCLSKQLSKCFQSLPSCSEAVKTFPALGMLRPWHTHTRTYRVTHTHTHMQRCTSINQLGHQGDLSSQKQAHCHVQMMGCWRTNTHTHRHILNCLQTQETQHWAHTLTFTHYIDTERMETQAHTHNSNTHVAPTHYGSADQKEWCSP